MRKIENLDNILRQKGLRATAQRLMICDEINKAGHIEIDNLYENLKKQIPSLSLATIYKNMHSLVKKEIISEVNIKGRKTIYEMTTESHIHYICTECGVIEDIAFDTMALVDKISELSEKNITDCKLTTFGLCTNCAN
ncbi:MAG: transcriptional repressor [Denitrovibrio sp.]|nr:MAG: transcriptional repressor [Denitrovibrio sp.]